MNRLLLLLLIVLILLLWRRPEKQVIIYQGTGVSKCYGHDPCGACTSCNYCAHCNAGGACGVCTARKPDTVQKRQVKSQCTAITKKGTRCSRSARSGGYCWQHGG